ncbi:glutaredoxin-like protein C5orf63 homolog [Diaphorina citri]|uniref:Glutaredoxin-like protein n=1 Tax=Diaphorina citri TaxID=121845 RepID=A0A1S3D318_DIACI|nr:glutaredoxin-like protein C5orf63 homolog [Diaphorina citri]
MSVLLEKLPVKSTFITSQRKPMLNLFTKDPCPLCDELKLELTPYLDRVHLEEVYLTPESYWYKLYRYEIPVLFLGGRFVCRNRFNAQVFETLLKNIEKELQ